MAINFDEGEVVRSLGLRYHQIPSKTAEPSEVNVLGFLKGIEAVKARGGKAHLHCMAGADRTGMYTFIYKMINGIDTKAQNLACGILEDLSPADSSVAARMVWIAVFCYICAPN
ncbi:MAG: hypothetical protein IIU05_05725 [Bacteroidales bacterium]|nr:hypothetical protein [Bacteroidales bacterium]